jgi:hypothetical protein
MWEPCTFLSEMQQGQASITNLPPQIDLYSPAWSLNAAWLDYYLCRRVGKEVSGRLLINGPLPISICNILTAVSEFIGCQFEMPHHPLPHGAVLWIGYIATC